MMRKPEFDVVAVHTVSLEGGAGPEYQLTDAGIQALQISDHGIVIEAEDGRQAILIPWHRVWECELKEISVKVN